MTLGKFIRNKRKDLKMTTIELSLRIKLSRPYITLIETDRLETRISEEIADKIAKVLKLNESEKEVFYNLYDDSELSPRVKKKIGFLTDKIKELENNKDKKKEDKPKIITFLGGNNQFTHNAIKKLTNSLKRPEFSYPQLHAEVFDTKILVIDLTEDLELSKERILMTRGEESGHHKDAIGRAGTIVDVLFKNKDINSAKTDLPPSYNYKLILGDKSIESREFWNFEYNREKVLAIALKQLGNTYPLIIINCQTCNSMKAINSFYASDKIFLCFHTEEEEQKLIAQVGGLLEKEPYLEVGTFKTLHLMDSLDNEYVSNENYSLKFPRMKTPLFTFITEDETSVERECGRTFIQEILGESTKYN